MAGFTEYVRLFTAIELDAGLRREIEIETSRLLVGLGRIGRVPEENLHVTLKFIGEVHRDDLAALDEVVADGAARLTPGEIEVCGIGAFPDLRRPRVLWTGVSDPSGILTPVHDRLNQTLKRFGAKREQKRYVPHVTIGRVRDRLDTEEFARRLDALEVVCANRILGAVDVAIRTYEEPCEEFWFGAQDVSAVTLFMSEPGRRGPPVYTVLGRYRSRNEAAGGAP